MQLMGASSDLQALTDRVDRLLLRHAELQRAYDLLQQERDNLANERDVLRSRLTAARQRLDTLIDRVPNTTHYPDEEA
jgi:cell division protein ZapB